VYVALRSVLGDKKNKSVQWGHQVPLGKRAGGIKQYQQLGVSYSVHNQLLVAVCCSAVVPALAIAAQQDSDRTKLQQ